MAGMTLHKLNLGFIGLHHLHAASANLPLHRPVLGGLPLAHRHKAGGGAKTEQWPVWPLLPSSFRSSPVPFRLFLHKPDASFQDGALIKVTGVAPEHHHSYSRMVEILEIYSLLTAPPLRRQPTVYLLCITL